MPLIKDVVLNDLAFASTEYVSEWVNVSSSENTTFSVFCSGACDIEIEYAYDDNFQITNTYTEVVAPGILTSVTKPVSSAFQRFKVVNIAPPQDLKLQGFFFQDKNTTFCR